MSRRPKKSMSGDLSRLGEIFKELGFKNPRDAESPPPEIIQRKPPEKGPCGKSMFETEKSVNTAIQHHLTRGRANTSFLRPYFCDVCHAWHMSSRPNLK